MASFAFFPLAASDPLFWRLLASGAVLLYAAQIVIIGRRAARLGRSEFNWAMYAIVLPVIAYMHLRLMQRRER